MVEQALRLNNMSLGRFVSMVHHYRDICGQCQDASIALSRGSVVYKFMSIFPYARSRFYCDLFSIHFGTPTSILQVPKNLRQFITHAGCASGCAPACNKGTFPPQLVHQKLRPLLVCCAFNRTPQVSPNLQCTTSLRALASSGFAFL